jgi:hypothetical protein
MTLLADIMRASSRGATPAPNIPLEPVALDSSSQASPILRAASGSVARTWSAKAR